MVKISKRFKRSYDNKKLIKKVFIFTEGEKTEPNYFEAIKKNIRSKNVEIIIKGNGYNTLSLVEYAIQSRLKNKNFSVENDEIWVVFDKDSFDSLFDNAIRKAESNNIKVAYSNESFELWYMLHFNYCDSVLGRKDYCKKLDVEISKLKGKNIKYKKNSIEMYQLIKDRESDAIKRAKKLFKSHEGELSYLKKKPSTTVHLLVESLNSISKDK